MTHIHHIGITCSDINRSERFYLEHFGLKKIKEIDAPAAWMKNIFNINSPAKLVYLKSEDAVIELFHFSEAGLKPTLGSISHFALTVKNRKHAFEKFKNDGFKTIFNDKGDGDYTYFIKDPDGVLIELKD